MLSWNMEDLLALIDCVVNILSMLTIHWMLCYIYFFNLALFMVTYHPVWFVDLSAAYDTVNHRILIQKLYNITQDSQLCRVLQNMLSNRRFYVELNNERSRWRIQKKGFHQCCSTSTLMTSYFIMERVASYSQTIYVLQSSTLHSQR